MISPKFPRLGLIAGSVVLALAFMSVPTVARANVYATDIQLNSTLTGTVHPVAGSFTLTYHLNDNATAGVTINILSGNTVVSSTPIAYPSAAGAGTSLGLNTVTLTAPATSGTYSVSIFAAATGYSTWQQISPLDTNHTTCWPRGLAVDKNITSPYYGRVVFGCGSNLLISSAVTPYATARSVQQLDGLYKWNADGTPADEGVFGYAGYTTDDAGKITAAQSGGANQMANLYTSGVGNPNSNPFSIVIGEDDRIYWSDDSNMGAIEACDMQAISSSTIFKEANYVNFNLSKRSEFDNVGNGWRQFDVINTTVTTTYTGSGGIYTGTAALFVNDEGDNPDEGVWMWHLVGSPGSMVADPTDTYGQNCVGISAAGANTLRTDGIAVDYNLDCFTCQDRNGSSTDPAYRNMLYANWNGGVLPLGDQGGISGAGGGGFTYSQTIAQWAVGSADPTDTGTFAGTFIDSRVHPTLAAFPMQTGYTNNGGIRLLNAFNAVPVITGIVNNNNGTLTINCAISSSYYPAISGSALSLVSSSGFSSSPAGPFSGSTGASFTALGGNTFTTTIPIPSAATFYQVACSTGQGTIVSGTVNSIDGTTSRGAHGNVTGTLANIDQGQFYFGCCFDNVGNLYGENTTDNYYKVWSPPGANSATTVAVVTMTTP